MGRFVGRFRVLALVNVLSIGLHSLGWYMARLILLHRAKRHAVTDAVGDFIGFYIAGHVGDFVCCARAGLYKYTMRLYMN